MAEPDFGVKRRPGHDRPSRLRTFSVGSAARSGAGGNYARPTPSTPRPMPADLWAATADFNLRHPGQIGSGPKFAEFGPRLTKWIILGQHWADFGNVWATIDNCRIGQT